MVPCRNEAGSIPDLLAALGAQTRAPTEIVVVDDQSTDALADVVRQWSRANDRIPVRILAGPGRGPGPAMNAGIAATSAEVIVRLDGHCVPSHDYIERSLEVLRAPRAGVAGGGWHVRPGAPTTVGRAIAAVVSHPLGSGGAPYRHPQSPGPVTSAVETVPFGAFRRAVWEQLGGFDEALSANEDFDFNYRVRKAGFDVVFDRRITATYVARPTLAALARQYFRYGFWKQRMLKKDFRALHRRQLPPILLVPWVSATTAWVALSPSAQSGAAAALYPAVLVLGAAHVARNFTTMPATVATLATVHLCWSAGFWRGAFGWAPPQR